MIVTKSQDVDCCRTCFLYGPDKDMGATIPACNELCDRELDSYLKFNKDCDENNSIALNCPFLFDLRVKISESLKKAVSSVPVDQPDELKKIVSTQKKYLKDEGVDVDIEGCQYGNGRKK